MPADNTDDNIVSHVRHTAKHLSVACCGQVLRSRHRRLVERHVAVDNDGDDAAAAARAHDAWIRASVGTVRLKIIGNLETMHDSD